MDEYQAFLAGKSQLDGMDGFAPVSMPGFLFPFQVSLTEWAIRKGRAAILADCGLGKTPMELVWADNVFRFTGRPVLLLTPLAVSAQIEQEAVKFGIEARVSRAGAVVAPITITNYERLHHFNQDDFAGVVCDESSAIKSFDGQRRAMVTEFLRRMPYRLLCTATAAPNDYVELGTSSEALGYLGHQDMLGRFFTNSETGNASGRRFYGQSAKWRFKGHAERPFWQWVSSWARAMRRPSDLGFSDEGFVLPELSYRRTVLDARYRPEGSLFERPAEGLHEEREETRRTIQQRCETVCDLLADAGSAVAWCNLNAEGDLLAELIDGAVQVSGADSLEAKEEALIGFTRGEFPILVTKAAIGAWGLNWQHCARMSYFPDHSYERFYQAIRRSWRFGQRRPVLVDLVTTEGGVAALENLERKAEQADRMFSELVAHMRDELNISRTVDYPVPVEVPAWAS